MVARVWRGWTRAGDVDRYVEYINRTGVAALAGTEGNRGAYIFSRAEGERAEVVVTSLWESLDSIRAFAGEEIERAVFYPEDDAFLVDREWTCSHYDVPVAVALR
jgi:heme-degrading monooxygenase HmoA